jgi:hypothetical protein
VKELTLKEDFLKEYCRLTGHDYALYEEGGTAPAGFLMTFTDPIVSETFLKFFIKFPRVIKGTIHTSSKVEVLHPLKLSAKNYREKLLIRNIEEKTGSKGDYFAVDFEVVLMDGQGGKVATDAHQFFLRV